MAIGTAVIRWSNILVALVIPLPPGVIPCCTPSILLLRCGGCEDCTNVFHLLICDEQRLRRCTGWPWRGTSLSPSTARTRPLWRPQVIRKFRLPELPQVAGWNLGVLRSLYLEKLICILFRHEFPRQITVGDTNTIRWRIRPWYYNLKCLWVLASTRWCISAILQIATNAVLAEPEANRFSPQPVPIASVSNVGQPLIKTYVLISEFD